MYRALQTKQEILNGQSLLVKQLNRTLVDSDTIRHLS